MDERSERATGNFQMMRKDGFEMAKRKRGRMNKQEYRKSSFMADYIRVRVRLTHTVLEKVK